MRRIFTVLESILIILSGDIIIMNRFLKVTDRNRDVSLIVLKNDVGLANSTCVENGLIDQEVKLLLQYLDLP